MAFNNDTNNLRKNLLRDRSPSVRQQTYQHVFWDQIAAVLGQPFDMTRIPLSKLYQMRRDPMISFALHFIKVPLITAPWYIECEDAQVAAFVDKALRNIYGTYLLQYMNSLDFGFAAIVKRFEEAPIDGTYENPDDPEQKRQQIWDNGNVDPVVWKSFVGLPPEMVQPNWNESNGEFNGIVYDVDNNTSLGFPTAPFTDNSNAKLVPLDNSLWITNDKASVFGSIWGYPRIGHAFRYWWSYWYWWSLLDRHVEKDADPPAIVRYPGNSETGDEALDADGRPIDFRDVALSIGEQARSGSTIALPSDVVESTPLFEGRVSNIPEWDIKFLEGGSNFDSFAKLFDRLEVLKLRSIWVPEQAFMEGQGGSSSRNVAENMTNSFERSQTVLMQEFDEHLNRFVIPQIIQINFPERKLTARKITAGFGADDVELQKLLVTLIGQNNPDELHVDASRVLERLNIPLLTPEQIQKKEQDAIELAKKMQPPTMQPANRAAGVSARTKEPNGPGVKSPTGFAEVEHIYVAPRAHYTVQQMNFDMSLPDSEQFRDPGIVGLSRQLRGLWHDTYTELYDDFASFVARQDLILEDNFDEALYLDAKDVSNKPGVTNWVEKLGGLPKKIADMAGDLITERGFDTSKAIATAVSRAKVLAAKHPEWAKAVAQWDKMKAEAGLKADEGDFAEVYFMLELAEEDDPAVKADKIINRWQSKIGSAIDRTQEIIKSIVNRAGKRELHRSSLSQDFDISNDDVANWMEVRGGDLIVGIDQTTRNELKNFLADELRANHSPDEMAAQIRAHFADFPDWKADRVARTETMLAYNQATLFAAQQAGLSQVQALDAQKGPTDQECHDRNGKVFSIRDAFTENLREHPNGTLSWRILKTKALSVEQLKPDESGGIVARYEPETEVVYLSEEMTADQQSEYLLMLGQQL